MTPESLARLRELNRQIANLEAAIRDLRNECNKIILEEKENEHE